MRRRNCHQPAEEMIGRTPRRAGQSGGAAAETAAPTELELEGERDQLLDRLARLQAEFENARKRAERESGELRDYVTGSVVEQFLPVLDNFELALKSTGSAEQLRSGVELIVKQMEEILGRMQVSRDCDGGRGVRSARARGAGIGGARRYARPACGRGDPPRLQNARAGCCGRRWCAWRIIRSSERMKAALAASRLSAFIQR